MAPALWWKCGGGGNVAEQWCQCADERVAGWRYEDVEVGATLSQSCHVECNTSHAISP